jgi:hypothetical protein
MSIVQASKNEFDSVPSLSISWNSLRNVCVISSLKVWQNLAVNPLSPGLFFVGRGFITVSFPLLITDLLRVRSKSFFGGVFRAF